MGFEVFDFIDRKMSGMSLLLTGVISPILISQAKSKTYWKDRSGNARQLINGGSEGGAGSYELYLAHGTEYGEFLEEGTGIYGPTKRTIVPVSKKVLSWLDEDGKRHFAKSIKGMKARPVLKDTLNENKSLIINTIEKYWSD